MVDYAAVFSKAAHFAVKPERWLQFFILDAVALLSVIILAAANFERYITLFAQSSTNPALFFALLAEFIPFVIICIVYWLVRLYIMGALIHQSYKEKEITKGYHTARQRYWSLLAAVIVVTIISFVLSLIPFVGVIFTLIASWAFFLVMQSVIVSKRGVSKSLQESWYIFKKHPGTIILVFIIITLISLLIVGVFALPLLIMFANVTIPVAGSGSAATAALLASRFASALPIVLVGLLVALVGLAIANTFAVKAQTELYLQLRKKRLGLF
jgi:hypothetical protein